MLQELEGQHPKLMGMPLSFNGTRPALRLWRRHWASTMPWSKVSAKTIKPFKPFECFAQKL